MLEFTRDGAYGGPKAKVWTEKDKIVYPNLHMLTEIDGFSFCCFKHLPQVRSSPAHFCGELRRSIKLNQFYTQQHWRMFPRITNKEIKIKIDKILQDLPFLLFCCREH